MLEVSASDDRKLITLHSQAVDIREVMKKLSEVTGVEVRIFEGVAGKLSLTLEKAPLEKVIDAALSLIGQRNYLMVHGGDGVEKIEIVPKKRPGEDSYTDFRKVKVRRKLRNGKEIEYYPGEVLVGLYGHPGMARYEEGIARNIADLSRKYNLEFLEKRVVFSTTFLKFRILDEVDAMDLPEKLGMYELVVPNGLGPKSLEVSEDLEVVVKSGVMRKYRPATGLVFDLDRRYVDQIVSIYLDGGDGASDVISFYDVLAIANDEGGMIVSHGGVGGHLYDLYFPDIHTAEDLNAKITKIASYEVFKRAKGDLTTVGYFTAGSGSKGLLSGIPNDERYRESKEWYLQKVRAEEAWRSITGSRQITVGVIDSGIDPDHLDLRDHISPESANFHIQLLDLNERPYVTSGLEDLDDGHGTHVSGIIAATAGNGEGIAGAAPGVTVLTLMRNIADARRQEEYAIYYAMGALGDAVFERFEGDDSNWPVKGNWAITNAVWHWGFRSIAVTASPTQEEILQFHDSDATSVADRAVRISFWAKLETAIPLHVEVSDTGGGTGAQWTSVGVAAGPNNGWQLHYYDVPATLVTNAFCFRFRLESSAGATASDRVYLDDVGVGINKAQVLNMSYDWYARDENVQRALITAYDSGVVLVGAADNASKELAAGDVAADVWQKVIVVAATDYDDQQWYFGPGHGSNWGASAIVDVSAPGAHIYSTVPTIDGGYDWKSGTSMATPVVSALAALLLQDGLTRDQVYERIKTTADPLPDLDPTVSSPWEGRMGTGRVNFYRAITNGTDGETPAAPTDFYTTREAAGMRLAWTPSSALDVSEYRVYRASVGANDCICPAQETIDKAGTILPFCIAETHPEGAQEHFLLARLIPEGSSIVVLSCLGPSNIESGMVNGGITILDKTASPGPAYSYRVVAVDSSGNVSDPALDPPLDIALVIDRSGSMTGSRIEHATRAGSLFLELLRTKNEYRGEIANQHRAGIFSFGESATSMREYTGVSWPSWAQADKLVAVNAETATSFQGVLNNVVNEVNANPQWTNMISGLEAARLALDEGLDGIANENGRGDRIFLLSDGDHNYYRCKSRYSIGGDEQGTAVDGPNFYVSGALTAGELCPSPPTECPRPTVACPGAGQLFPTGVGISTVSLGSDISENGRQVLVNLAANTGGSGGQPGEWYDVSVSDSQTTLDLEKVYVKMLMQATGGVNVESIDDDLGPNETQRQLVSVDSSMREATFIVTWADDAVPVELVLRAPDGSYIDPIAAQAAEGIEFVAGRGYQFYHVIEPRAGPWEMVVTAAATTPYSAMLIGESLLKMALNFDRLAYVANDPITLSVKIFQPDGTLISGAQVGGFVQTPSQINEITLNDLGQLGDPVASDGVYTAIYNGAASQGAYTFSLRAAGLTTAGEAFSREDLHSIYVASTSGPEAPRMLTATGGAGYVDLSWINPMSVNLEAVRIMRSTAGHPNNINEGQMVYDGLSVLFRDLDVVNGTTYYYAAFARNTDQEYSLPSTDARAVATPSAIDTEPPQPIRDLSIISGNGLVSLYWSNPLNSDFSHVLILRRQDACATSCSDPSATVFAPPPDATSFTDSTALNGVTYCYAIFAVDTAGNCSGAGTNSSGTATPQAPVIQPPVNDPLFSMQWHLHNEGQTGGKVDADMDAPEAWQIEQGSNQVVIAIVDTGVDYDHPDLAFNIRQNYGEIPGNGLDDDGNGYVDDYYGYDFTGARDSDPKDDFGHGTHCAGIADAVTNNGIGVAGVARQAKIQSVKVLDAGGRGYWEWVAAGIIYAADNGADVISMSLGGPHSKLVEDACDYARDRGVVVIAAAGNAATSVKSYPGGFESVIAVAATDHDDQPAWFSNYGDWVDVSAPGVNIYATMPTYGVTMNSWGYTPEYAHMSGTSMACPNVAGLAALILARYPDLTRDQVREALVNTGDDLGARGFDQYFGHGRVNAATAMSMDTVGPLEVAKWRVRDGASAYPGVQGNGDGVANPGETVGLSLALKNRGGQSAGAVTAQLTIGDPYVMFVGASALRFVSLPRWSTSESAAPVLLAVAPSCPVPHYVPVHAVLTDDAGGRWELDFAVSIGIYGPSLRVSETIVDDDANQQSAGNGDGIVNSGETIELFLRLRNDGDLPAAGVRATLASADPLSKGFLRFLQRCAKCRKSHMYNSLLLQHHEFLD